MIFRNRSVTTVSHLALAILLVSAITFYVIFEYGPPKYLIWLFLADLLVIFGLFLLFESWVIKPLKRIETYVASIIPKGEKDSGIHKAVFRGGLEGLRLSIEKMVDQLCTHNEELQKEQGVGRVSENLFRAVFNSSNDAVFILKNGAYVDANPKTFTMFGYTREEVLQAKIGLFSSNEAPYTRESLQILMKKAENGESQYSDWRCRRKDGSLFWGEGSLTSAMISGDSFVLITLRDISERKIAHDRLQASEEMFSKLFLVGPIPIALTILQSGKIMNVNEAFSNWIGYSREELIGRSTEELKFWASLAERENFVKAIRSQGFVEKSEVKVRKFSGDLATCLLSGRTVVLGGQQCLLTSAEDITQQKALQEDLKRSLNEKDVLLKEVHHRVKNNLQVVSSLLSLQASRARDPAVRDVFFESQFRISSMAHIHNRLYQSPRFDRISFAEYIQGLVGDLSKTYRMNNVEVKTEIQDIVLDIDAVIPCGLLITELISNSMKHAFPKNRRGVITICMKRRVSLINNQDIYELVVSDDGVGFPKDFDFEKAETLGLRLVSTFALQLQGSFLFHDDNGARFQMTFSPTHLQSISQLASLDVREPIKNASKSSDSIEKVILSGEKVTATSKKKILIVEDELINAIYLSGVLQGAGYDIASIASTGDAAVTIAEIEKPDIALMDINLKGTLNGIEVAKSIHSRFNIGTIFLSGYPESDFGSAIHGPWKLGYISKPYNTEQIEKAIKSVNSH